MNNLRDKSNIPGLVCAVIPFFNEKSTLQIVLDEVLNYVQFIFAVNDGSTDNFYLNQDYSNIKIISLDKNYGKGKALYVGFQAAISAGYDSIVTLDADLQHEPKLIPLLLDGLDKFDIVIGNRLKNLKGMPLQRRLSNKLTSFLLSLKTSQKIIDSQCGFRAYSVKVLKDVKTKYFGFEAESEILVLAARKGYKIGFIDIPTIYGTGKSKMRPLQAIIGFMKVILKSA